MAKEEARLANLRAKKRYRETKKYKKASASYHQRVVKERPKSLILSAARYRAKKLGVPFTISQVDIDIPERCPVLGIPLLRSTTGTFTDNSPSLDRILPHLGYIPGNVAVISMRANRIKSNATAEELQAVVDWLAGT